MKKKREVIFWNIIRNRYMSSDGLLQSLPTVGFLCFKNFLQYFSGGVWNSICNVAWLHQVAILSIGILCTTDVTIFVMLQSLGKNCKTIIIKMFLFHFYSHINPLSHIQRILKNKPNENIMQQEIELQFSELTLLKLVHLLHDCFRFWGLVEV